MSTGNAADESLKRKADEPVEETPKKLKADAPEEIPTGDTSKPTEDKPAETDASDEKAATNGDAAAATTDKKTESAKPLSAKAKGKLSKRYEDVPEDDGDDEDDDDDDEDDDFEGDDNDDVLDDEEEDSLEEIDVANIIPGGRRTRGKVIDFKKTMEELEKEKQAKQAQGETTGAVDDDEDDDEFKAAE